jgi:predicted nucleotidyltransferase
LSAWAELLDARARPWDDCLRLDTGDPILTEATRRIAERFQPLRIVLFGSRAWGEPDGDSDYDLLVLMEPADDPPTLETRIYRELAGLPASFDVIVRSARWWEEWWDTPFSLERRIQTEGIAIHDAS